ncbi:MAG: 1,4-dihydroxy-2-naphthoate octaprenyltransferase [Candidatus Omnitrophota bacterium]
MKPDRIKVWIRAIRAPFFTASIIPVMLGSVAAWHHTGYFSWPKFWLTLSGIVFIHGGTNLSNDYFDHTSGCDKANSNPTPFSGGSRVIQEGAISSKSILYAALAFIIFGGAIGLYLNHVSSGNAILIIGIIGVFLGLFYTAEPVRIGYGGLGELAVGVGFGPVIVIGSYYVQAQNLPLNIFLVSAPIGILVALIVLINEFPDYFGDKKVNKETLVVILGKKKAIIVYHFLLGLVYLLIVSLVYIKALPPLCLITFLTLPLALKAYRVSKEKFSKIDELLPANAATIGIHSLVGLLLCIGMLMDKIL